MFGDTKYSDFTIICKGKELPVHKLVLASHGPVFSAMLEPHTKEAQTNRVEYEDIDYEVFSWIFNKATIEIFKKRNKIRNILNGATQNV